MITPFHESLLAFWRRIHRRDVANAVVQTFDMPALQTERLVLRQFRQDDLGDVVGWMEPSSIPNTEYEAQQFLNFCFRQYRERGIGPWGIELKRIRRVVGNCGFPHINDHCGEINYYVASQYRSQGLASEAVKAILEFGFKDLALKRIQARCAIDNVASERVMQKAGMRFERVLRHSPSASRNHCNERLYTIIRDLR
jgi:ribosomal-protein-alanine N-acetyltransferase